MFKRLINTQNDVAALVLRLVLGYVFFFHGMQKLTTLYGGYGFSGTMGFFTEKLGVPAVFAFLAIMAEGIGWAGLISGFLTRIAALGITVNMIVAVKMLHFQNGIFMNWFGNQKGEGYEYHLLVIAIGVALMIKGGGALSVDRLLSDKK
ncbi:MAG: DoxX family protein [Nitrospiraceae bacterium]|nr:DoxX family protein [Nitrospiraceae bacterium]